MNREEWIERIRQATNEAGTYKPHFDDVIDTLAGILELRDDAKVKFEASGGEVTVEHTNARGATNISKNPALVILMDCNTQALNYWRELGLTPRAYKSMTGSLNVKVEKKSIEDMLEELGI